ncbi:MAG: hypothetical protein ABIK09_17280 [Pseudomonadota bacterium]
MMNSRVALIALLVAGCGAAGPTMLESSTPQRPDWIGKPSYPMGGFLYYNGLSTGAESLEEARRTARQDALLTMAQEIAVEIGGEIATKQIVVDQQQSVDVRITTSARTESVKVEDVKFVQDYSETWRRSGLVYDAYALVAIPRAAIWRARCDAKGHVLLAFACTDGAAGICASSHRDRVRAALSEAGITLLPDLAEPGDPAALAATGLEKCAARVVVVQVESRFLGTQGDEHYAEASGNVRVLQSGTAEELAAFTVGPVKGGHYTKADALRAALGKAIDELGTELKVRLGN